MNSIVLSALLLAGAGDLLTNPLPGEAADNASAAQEPIQKEPIKPDAAKSIWEYLAGRYDADSDGKISPKEYTRGATQFGRLDKDKNGFIEEADTRASGGRGERGGRRGGGAGRGARVEPPTEGSMAPDFELETLYPKEEAAKSPEKKTGSDSERPDVGPESAAEPEFESTKLSSLKGKRPVALIFGSYT